MPEGREVGLAKPARMVLIRGAIMSGLAIYLVFKGLSWLANGSLVAELATTADHAIYKEAADRIWTGGPIYLDWELNGPFDVSAQPELYPPPTILGLIVPMSRLPDVLWWAVPMAVIAIHIALSRPSSTGWLVILACLAMPRTWIAIASGGVAMWMAAALALGTRFGWPAMAVLLKPTLAPLALVGARNRWWWAALVVAGLSSLLLARFWLDYLQVLANFNDPRGIWYSVEELPLMAVPLAAWYWRSTRPLTRSYPLGTATRQRFSRIVSLILRVDRRRQYGLAPTSTAR